MQFAEGLYHIDIFMVCFSLTETLPQAATVYETQPSAQMLAPSTTMRTVYLGGLPASLTLEEILNHITGGIIEQVRYFPERNCVFVTFLDANAAYGLFLSAQQRRLVIAGAEVKVGWGKQSNIPLPIVHAVINGATRNVFIGNIDESVTMACLQQEFAVFGTVDHIKILYEKRIAFVHMASIAQAMKAVSVLQIDPRWMQRRVHYGRDRCAPPGTNPLASLPQALVKNMVREGGELLMPLNSPGNIPNRTIYLGGVHPDVATKDICDAIRGGILQHIKYMPEKNIAFVTFVDAGAANAFYDRVSHEGLVFKGKKVKIGWGKPTPLPTSVQTAVQNQQASRNVYIGSIDDTISEEKLRTDFGQFGDIELINLIPDKNIGFVNFSDILSAIRAVEVMKASPEYHRYKINYGKDRCGNPPRSSNNASISLSSSSLSLSTTSTAVLPPVGTTSTGLLSSNAVSATATNSSVLAGMVGLRPSPVSTPDHSPTVQKTLSRPGLAHLAPSSAISKTHQIHHHHHWMSQSANVSPIRDSSSPSTPLHSGKISTASTPGLTYSGLGSSSSYSKAPGFSGTSSEPAMELRSRSTSPTDLVQHPFYSLGRLKIDKDAQPSW